MTPLGTFPLAVNSPVNINVQQRGGVVELLNYAPYDLSLQGPFGQTTLSGGSRVGYSNPQYGMQIVGIPSAPGVTLNTSQINLVANWYDASELQPYPPTSIGNLIQAPAQGGGQSSVQPVTNSNVAAGGTQGLGGVPGKVLYLYGFDISGDKAVANTGFMTISGLVNPINGIAISPLGYWLNQSPTGTQPLGVRFPVAMQSDNLGTNVVFHYPSMTAGVTIVIWIALY
jgi:hypothetical protein